MLAKVCWERRLRRCWGGGGVLMNRGLQSPVAMLWRGFKNILQASMCMLLICPRRQAGGPKYFCIMYYRWILEESRLSIPFPSCLPSSRVAHPAQRRASGILKTPASPYFSYAAQPLKVDFPRMCNTEMREGRLAPMAAQSVRKKSSKWKGLCGEPSTTIPRPAWGPRSPKLSWGSTLFHSLFVFFSFYSSAQCLPCPLLM